MPFALSQAQAAPDRASPFTAVRWQGEDPRVQVDGAWYEFESLDGISKSDILAFARQTYGDRWQKRFSEDLVELLRTMGRQPGAEVRLGLRLNGQAVTRTARMTEENRSSVVRFNQNVEAGAPATRPAVSGALPISAGQQTASQRRMAAMMAEEADRLWDQKPEEGRANLRFLVTKDGSPVEGVVSITTEFRFRAERRGGQSSQGFNPNGKGRWVYEGLRPGVYTLVIEGVGRFEAFTWSQSDVTIEEGATPLFEVKIEGA
jgi:hypothetical protein